MIGNNLTVEERKKKKKNEDNVKLPKGLQTELNPCRVQGIQVFTI